MAWFTRLGDLLASSPYLRRRSRMLLCSLAAAGGVCIAWTALGHSPQAAPQPAAEPPRLAESPGIGRITLKPSVAVKAVNGGDGANSNAGIIARVECDSDCGTSLELMPRERHKRPDYVVDAPDVLSLAVRADGADETLLAALNGEFLVQPDGSLNLSEEFGQVQVGGLTLGELPERIQECLQPQIADAQVLVSVAMQNSKVYYIVTNGDNGCDSVQRMPALGGETTRDALSQVSDVDWEEKTVWIARPAPGSEPTDEILTINAAEVLDGTDTSTNYPLLPGDRVFITNQPALWHTLGGILSSTWDTLIEMFW
jgi:hypothetical protein